MASERGVRILSEEMVGENLAAEEVPLSEPLRFGVDLKLSPMVYIPDLVGKIFQLLEQNARYNVHKYYITNIHFILREQHKTYMYISHMYMYMYICTYMYIATTG